ncbi:alpha/beta hydrolase [Roseomonas sp. OT10]|nr:alpha/beta hydrolase [Roseomonas sp. OT10]UFN48928.1 alpha/beta hydrolase [Roseomonas sp. OT10]
MPVEIGGRRRCAGIRQIIGGSTQQHLNFADLDCLEGRIGEGGETHRQIHFLAGQIEQMIGHQHPGLDVRMLPKKFPEDRHDLHAAEQLPSGQDDLTLERSGSRVRLDLAKPGQDITPYRDIPLARWRQAEPACRPEQKDIAGLPLKQRYGPRDGCRPLTVASRRSSERTFVHGRDKQRHRIQPVHRFSICFQDHQPPLLAEWGRHDPAFVPSGGEAHRKDLPDAEIHLIDAGHFALETPAAEFADHIVDFLARKQAVNGTVCAGKQP